MAFKPIQYFCLNGESGKFPIFLEHIIKQIQEGFDFE